MSRRTEAWTRDGRTAMVDVDDRECVLISYELFASMIAELGFVQHAEDDR